MKIEDVPQEKGMIGDYGHEICYAVGENGKYTLSPSLGWDPKNIVNEQAWSVIAEETKKIHILVKSGKLSPIAYYQAKNQMDISLLASYVEMARWRVILHRKPFFFRSLPVRILKKYTVAFQISLEELQSIPETFVPEMIQQ